MFYHDLCATYSNTEKWHGDYFDILYQRVQQTPYLKEHRDWVEQNEWGMGDRPFSAMWEAIIETMPDPFRFLEIGCYRGQVLSLVGLISKHQGKTPLIVGVSPFRGTHDMSNTYSNTFDYSADIKTIFEKFQVPYEWFTPVQGMSQQPEVVEEAAKHTPYNIVYIDGGHRYDAVREDIENYTPMLMNGGILVVDDASCHLNMPEFSNDKGYNRCWPGLRTVSGAVRDFLEPRSDFVHRFAIGYNRIFEKTK